MHIRTHILNNVSDVTVQADTTRRRNFFSIPFRRRGHKSKKETEVSAGAVDESDGSDAGSAKEMYAVVAIVQ